VIVAGVCVITMSGKKLESDSGEWLIQCFIFIFF
jgi:hypothetical protein